MSDAKHTPGPWEVVLFFPDDCKDEGYWIRDEINRNWIARVHRWNGAPRSPDATSKANAYVLAAAPDLLAAWEQFLVAKNADETTAAALAGLAAVQKARGKAVAAIAKATGK